jgi:hypothetical protein
VERALDLVRNPEAEGSDPLDRSLRAACTLEGSQREESVLERSSGRGASGCIVDGSE